MIQGGTPRQVIGTVNAAEVFVTFTAAATFIFALGWEVVTTATLGLLAGGIVAAPFGAVLAKRLKADVLIMLVGLLLIITSLVGLARAIF
jgi:uncharacterized membrane protein YfcA